MTGRRAAFDPSRLDNELDQLLPPAAPLRPRPQLAPVVTPPDEQPAAGETPSEPTPVTPRAGRGGGGRPAGPAKTRRSGDVLITAVRIPTPLFAEVVDGLLASRLERPSYAQVIAWTCEDHRDDVLAELDHIQRTSGRVPRGRRLATDAVSLTLRFQPAEASVVNDLIATASRGKDAITRTALVIAALRVAVKRGLSLGS